MIMSSGSGIYTYTGVWINWSHGAIQGATLTLPQQYGGLLVAFLAIYVSFAGSQFWKFLTFILHQINTTKPGNEHDGLHHQLQVILRNSNGAGGAFWEFIKLPIYWRGRTRRPFYRVTPFLLLGALNLALFSVASVFTSQVTRVPGNSTIILGPSCGELTFNYSRYGNGDIITQSKILADTYEAAAYVRQCYGDNANGLACRVYNRPSLEFTTNPNAACPFASNICLYNDKSAFSMDTGLIDSHWDLGINAQPEHRIKYRHLTTCAPLHAKQWTTTANVTGIGLVIYINAGPLLGNNYTFSYVVSSSYAGFGYKLRLDFQS
jgi:hypothetical protein